MTTNESYTWTADYIKKAGVKSVGVTYLNTADWGIPAYAAFKAEAKKIGLKITDAEGVLDTSDDYRPSLTNAVAGKPQAFVHIGYGPDAAKIALQRAGTTGGSAGSPRPVGAKSVRRQWTSTAGACVRRRSGKSWKLLCTTRPFFADHSR